MYPADSESVNVTLLGRPPSVTENNSSVSIFLIPQLKSTDCLNFSLHAVILEFKQKMLNQNVLFSATLTKWTIKYTNLTMVL